MTIVQTIDAAVAATRERLRQDAGTGDNGAREFAVAITHLETARMFVNAGMAKRLGVHRPADIEAGIEAGAQAEELP